MTTPRAHADLAKLYFSDSEMKCWIWDEFGKKWQELDDPSFSPEFIYHVGKTEPTDPPQTMCELAGVKFPMPAQEKLTYGQLYFSPMVSNPDTPIEEVWDSTCIDEKYLKSGTVQLTKEGAIQQAKAIQVALKQATEKAKEKTK